MNDDKVAMRDGPFGLNYFRCGPNRWWRFFGFQLGYHRHGRRRTFSERQGLRSGPHHLRLGRAELSFSRLDRKAKP